MQDMRCPRNTFLKHFIMPDDELKKKGYAVDKLDESTIKTMQVFIYSIYLWIRRDSKYQKYCLIPKILVWRRKEFLMLFINA
jgi:hypothetical protein